METAVIIGIRGQLASYLSEKFLAEGYKVVGVGRRCSMPDYSNINGILDNPNFRLYEADVCDFLSISGLVKDTKPKFLLNCAAQSHVGSSYKQPIITNEINYIGVNNLLEAVRLFSPETIFWSSCTSERFGNTPFIEQNEDTPPYPVSPYAVSKVASEYLIKAYRHTYNMKASYSIMFNFESPRRSKAFVTRKITNYIGEIFNKVENYITNCFGNSNAVKFYSAKESFEICLEKGVIQPLKLGNIDTYRSWTHCLDTVDGIFKQITEYPTSDFIFGREETHSVREFLKEAFAVIGIYDWNRFVVQDQEFMRPSDVLLLRPNCQKAKDLLGWKPKITFNELVREMVENDIAFHSIRQGQERSLNRQEVESSS